MARKKNEGSSFASEEQERSTYTVNRPTLITGSWYEKGDDVELYPNEARWYVHYGYIEGDPIDDAFGPGEIAAGAPNVLKRSEDRDDMEVAPSVDEMFAKHDTGASREVGEYHDGTAASDSSSASESK